MTSCIARVQSFLGAGGRDVNGRTLAQILAWSDADLERHHDFIQWLFPLTEPSAFNPDAPVLSAREAAVLAGDSAVRAGVLAALDRMLSFYGLRRDEAGQVVRTDRWPQRSAQWASAATHNDLRISRILKSLTLLDLRAPAQALLAALERDVPGCRGAAAQSALAHWRAAVGD